MLQLQASLCQDRKGRARHSSWHRPGSMVRQKRVQSGQTHLRSIWVACSYSICMRQRWTAVILRTQCLSKHLHAPLCIHWVDAGFDVTVRVPPALHRQSTEYEVWEITEGATWDRWVDDDACRAGQACDNADQQLMLAGGGIGVDASGGHH